jgi:hypothetical protein
MNDEIIEVAIRDIQIGRRFRRDHGNVEDLARQIEQCELLQPIGVTEKLRLVYGERRLRAYRDVLKRDTIPARIVDPRSVELAQIDENVLRKDFTISEKVEIVDFLRGYKHGGKRKPLHEGNCTLELLTVDQAAKRAGLKNRDAYNRAKDVVRKGVPELVKAMDDLEISVSAAAELASLDREMQRTLLAVKKDWTAAEIVRIKQQEQEGVEDRPAEPTSEASDELKVEPEGEQPVLSGFHPVNQRDVDPPVVVPSGSDEGRLDDADDETEPVPAGRDGDSYNFYPTPRYVTEALLEVEEFGSLVWECACGDGAISEVLIKEGYEVVSSDIVDRGYGEVEDFFQSDRTAESIVTNPDYDYAKEFVQTALAKTTDKVAMLLPLTFLTARTRYELLTLTPLKAVYVFSSRVSLYPHGWSGPKKGGVMNFAWFVWEHGYQGDPRLHLFHPDVGDEVVKTEAHRPRPKHPARQVG